ncbi:MAG: hypothetical protein WAK16_02560 [Candidatus Cybelea sp.]
MRLSMIRAGLLATVAAVALAACAGSGMPGYGGGYTPSAPNGPVVQQSEPSGADQSDRDDTETAAPVTTATATANALALPAAVTTCEKSPPQYWWIFKGACDPKITLKSTGATFKLQKYEDITVTGTIGNNTTKGSATIAIADAVDKGDISNWKGKAFPKYTAKGVFIYAVAVNQSTQTIKPKPVKGKPVLQYVITDSKGLPGKTCFVALLAESQGGKFIWTPFPGQFTAKGDTITITQYEVPKGFEIPPKTPLYFAVNCD